MASAVGHLPCGAGPHRSERLYVTAPCNRRAGDLSKSLGFSELFKVLLAKFVGEVSAGRDHRVVLVLDNAGRPSGTRPNACDPQPARRPLPLRT